MSTKGTHDGHRDRMREKFVEHGRMAFADHEMLEMILYYCIPRKNTNDIAHKLIERFTSLAGVMDASIEELMECGLSKNAAVYLHLIRETGRSYYVEEAEKPRFITVGDAADYITKLLYREKNEQMYIFMLDMSMRLISYKKLAEGGLDKVAVDLRNLIKTVLSTNASYVILAHNHPSGSARPTRQDIDITSKIVKLLATVDVKLCDHIIVSNDKYYSFNKGMGIEDDDGSGTLSAHQYANITK